jgi:hypothetical protein
VSLPSPSEFQSVDGFYEPQDGGVLFTLSPLLLLAVALLLVLAGLLGWWIGRRKTDGDDPSQAIYDAIKKAVTAAAGAPRDSVMITARHLNTVLEDRLGAVLRIGHGLGGPHEALTQALDGHGPADHEPDKDHPADPHTGVNKVTINARSVVLNTHAAPVEGAAPDPHADAHPAQGHAAGHATGHGGGHGHTKPLDARAQLAAVRAAVHDLSDYWSDKSARLKDLREARKQLTTTPPPSSDNRVGDRRAP